MKFHNRAHRAQPRPNRAPGTVPLTAPTAPHPLQGGAVRSGRGEHTNTTQARPPDLTALDHQLDPDGRAHWRAHIHHLVDTNLHREDAA